MGIPRLRATLLPCSPSPVWPGRWGLPQATPALEHVRDVFAAEAESREGGLYGQRREPGDLAHLLALADQ
ncbi:hypothetical protein WME89_01895 [Sorangium sp. So ce321]|uniref:hypothetical protein n=1 Tax=Sorangium sp. So ce321 TaxID=3133300 RepID=UPI003F63C40F